MSSLQTIKVVEKCHISPPPATVPPTSIPLTFLDIPWFFSVPGKRLFFFEFNHDSEHFMNHILTSLKHSLSLTLQHFFPLAGHLEFPPPPAKPHLIYRDSDSVSLTVAESSSDFQILIGNQPRDCKEFLPLIAELQSARESDESISYPIMALQVTIFPNSGICISITNLHMIDGQTCSHFMKSWASISNSGGDITCMENSLPFYDRSIIKDPDGILDIYLKQWYASKCKILDGEIGISNINNVRVTFLLNSQDIKKMKLWISTQLKQPLHLTTFCVATAFIWVCMQKTKNNGYNSSSDKNDDDEIQTLLFLADCRNRLEYEVPITYFGNCIVPVQVSAKKCELDGAYGVVVAAKAIAKEVNQMKNEPLKRIDEESLANLGKLSAPLTVAGSPRFKFYETDFGWGKMRKSEMGQIGDSSVVSVGDSKDGNGGIEIGVAMSKPQMDTFSLMFQQGINIFSS